jgi:hypothetical protein
MQKLGRWFVVAGFLGIVLTAGCGQGKGEKTQVSGTVTIDGKPPKGKGYQLRFNRVGAPSTTIDVNDDGSFSGEAVTGPNDVELVPGASGHEASGGKSPMYATSTFAQQRIDVKKNDSLTLDFSKDGKSGSKAGH